MSNAKQIFLPQDKITVLNKSSRRSESRRAIPQNSYYEPNWTEALSKPASKYESLARGRFNFDKWLIKPQESRSIQSYEVENTFINGTNRIISRYNDHNWKPLVRRSPLLIDKELLPIN